MNSNCFPISQLFYYFNNLTDFNGFEFEFSVSLINSIYRINANIFNLCSKLFPIDAKCSLNASTISLLSVISVFLIITFSMELALIS